ncbi:MAG: hypothetical protein IPP94_06510 [Ignavibacteria bacterium]|nr:hypothetical protein [Ignavibacteria bacterium]
MRRHAVSSAREGSGAFPSPLRRSCAVALLGFLALIALAPALRAQSWLYPETLADLSPLLSADRPEGLRFLPSTRFWGETGHYIAGRDENHRWHEAIGGAIELVGARDWSVWFESSVLLAIDPNNNIAFNPRAFFWEEGLMLGLRSGADVWSFGFRQRCKHDIDNIELLRATGVEQQRSIIYGGLVARWERDPMRVAPVTLRPLAEANLVLLTEDQRFPVATRVVGPSVNAFLGALRLRVTGDLPLAADVRCGLTADARFTLLGPWPGTRFSGVHALRSEPALEGFVAIDGSAATFAVFARAAVLDDDFISTPPRSAKLLALGIRILPR